ncbi:KMT2A.2 family protein [Megaselia abdita]
MFGKCTKGGKSCKRKKRFENNPASKPSEKPPSSEPPDGGGGTTSANGNDTPSEEPLSSVVSSSITVNSNSSTGNKKDKNGKPAIAAAATATTIGGTVAATSSTTTTTTKKKTVTFKNIPESSDDACTVKKVYNPDIKTPLVSIIKKESLNRSTLQEPIIKPSRLDGIFENNNAVNKVTNKVDSRLTEILLKNNPNKVDKLNFLTFRSSRVPSPACGKSALSTPSLGEVENPGNSKSLPSEPASIPVVVDFNNIKESSTSTVIKSEVEKVSKDEKTSAATTISASTSSACPLPSSSTSITLTTPSSSSSSSSTSSSSITINTLPTSTASGNNDKSVVIGDKRFVLPKRSAHSRRVIKPNKRFLDDSGSGVASLALSGSRKSLASSSGNKLNRKLVVTVDSIKDNNGSLIENHKNHKVQQQLLSASVSISVATSGLSATAVSPKGAVGSTTTDIVDDDSAQLKGSSKDEDIVSSSCFKHTTTATSSNGKNKCDIKSGGDGEADYISDNLKGNSKRTDREDKGSECEKNKETQSDATDDDEEESMEHKSQFSSNPFTKCHDNLFTPMSTTASSSSMLSASSNNKGILRQPRLQFGGSTSSTVSATASSSVASTATPAPTTNLGLFDPSNLNKLCNRPFSLNLNSTSTAANNSSTVAIGGGSGNSSNSNSSTVGSSAATTSNSLLSSQTNLLMGSNSCGVCNVPITSKNLQQSRKYGIYACEACRKFIKTVKKSVMSSDSLSSPSSSPNSSSTSPSRTVITTQPQLQCIKGDGSCSIASSNKVNMKHYNRLCKDRCQACWLKRCLKLFNLPSGHKQHLMAILPTSYTKDKHTNNSSSNNISNFSIKKEISSSTGGLFMSNPSKLINWGSSDDASQQQQHKSIISNPLAENNSTFGSTPLSKSSVFEKSALLVGLADKVANPEKAIEVNSKVIPEEEVKKETPKTESNPDTTIECNKSKLRRKETETPVPSQPAAPTPITTPAEQHPPKRQKIDLKGPRVKHVCRSASIVLGQPIATFGDEQQGLETMDTPPRPESPSTAEVELPLSVIRDNCSNCATSTTNTDLGLSPPATPIENRMGEDFAMATIEEEKCPPPPTTVAVKPASKPSVLVPRNLNAFSKKFVQETQDTPSKTKIKLPTTISIDFWENYDPAEVSQTGFGIIVTEDLPIRSLCFLCGSTGMDPMVYCACCCEPYHQYCVQDEYNLKHSSMDDTMISLLDTSLNPTENLNLITNRLNWLCPRCTVCYTCNQSSGSKVKCQKCQKNYHSTCLGTSKRLVGADRPLICVNCLKCKSCGTTKVSKFIGNLPMCSQCFKLRKKGNFCPICQKCYEDNDFDLKMMECGDCQRWVHSKCEELTDEQYQMLSTLPESIEFICRKCAKINPMAKERAKEWRDAVALEFKSGLLSVVKLLSKSRQACALLKLSPRKKASSSSCYACQISSSSAARALQFSSNSDEEDSQHSEADQVIPSSSCSCLKTMSSVNDVTLVDVKMKINSDDYISLSEFNYDMNNVIMSSNCDELLFAYKEILSEQFPWFQNETKACTDALEEDMFDACAYSQNADDIERGDQQVPVIDLPDTIDNCLYVEDFKNDQRACMFCKKVGEGDSAHESRLLYCGHNQWVHTNCAMWSAEVFEEIDGSLQNVHSAISRGRKIKCTVCQNRGATVGCNVKSCGEHYHYPCARSISCAFMTDKTVYCPAHLTYAGLKKATIEKSFEVVRPVYVELDRKKKKLIEPTKIHFVIGSLEVKNLGTIVPRFSNNSEAIIPINFMCTRLYWSTKEPWKIVEYSIRTYVENNISSTITDLGRNFTVDHMSSTSLIKMAQIQKWHSSLSGDRFDDESVAPPQTEEEPQNNADLLPPDLKDAIFEDLPHEILDGISMLDIFPNQLVTDDMITIDPKTEGFFLNEQSKDNSTTISDFEGATESASIHELSIGQVLSSFSEEDSRKSGTKQRSWVKVDNTNAKRRKLSKGLSEFLNLGNRKYDFSTRKTSQTVSTTQNEDIKTKTFTWSAAKRYTCTTTSTSSEIDKLMQLDGMDDTIIVTVGGPVKCDRCHGTYRTSESYQRHLANCEAFSTSESESEPAQSPEVQSPPIQSASQQQPISFIQNSIPITNLQGSIAGIPLTQTIPTIQSIPMSQFTTQGISNLQQSQYYPATSFNTVSAGQPQIFTMATVDGNQQIVSFAPQNNTRTSTTQQYYHHEPKQSPPQKLQAKPGPGRPMKGRPPGSSKPPLVKKKPPLLQPQMTTNPQIHTSNVNQPQTIQILNQNLLQQQPQIILQQNGSSSTSQPIILQQPQQQTTFVATDASGNQVQYLAQQPTAQPTFLTTATNPMLQGTTFLQTDASGNLVFTNTAPGIQMLSSAQLQPQVIGTLIQPQALQLASGEQLMVANSTPTLEMMGNQMILTTTPTNQPMYYGLETIVQNTVMQSQQFVSTAAMQGVLSQNASFSATTTQVFQASKIEPVVDIPAGYVLVNNDGTIIQQSSQPQQAIYNIQQSQPQQQQQQHHHHLQQQQQQPPQIISNPPLKPTSMPPPVAPVVNTRPQIRSLSPAKPTGKSMPIQHINKVNPTKTEVKLPTRHPVKPPQTMTQTQKMGIPSQNQHPLRPKMVNSIARSNTAFPVIQPMQRKSTSANMIRPLNKVSTVTTAVPIKPKIMQKPCIPQKKSMIAPKPIITKTQIPHHKIMQPSIPVPSPVVPASIEIFDEKLSEMVQQNIEQQIQQVEQHVEEPQIPQIPHEITIEDITESSIVTYWPQQPQQQPMPATNSIQLPSAPYNSNVLPTNVVSPIVQPPSTPRPTNRVLPMQSIQPQKPPQLRTSKDEQQKVPYGSPVLLTQTPADSPDLKMSVEISEPVEQIVDDEMEMVVNEAVTITEEQIEEILKSTPPRATDYGEAGTKIDANEDDFIPTNMEFNLKEADIGDGDDLSGGNSSPDVKEKICEILENLENEDCQKFVLPVPVPPTLEPPVKCPDPTEKENINPCTDLQFQKLKASQTIVTPAQTNVPPPQTVGPKLLFEIQSEDGFTYKSSSISDVWEKLFEAVQVARKAHGLLPLPEGPLADMSGVQMLGLKTNAIRYLIEQLPGVEKCKKYTPKYHRRSLFECSSGSMSGYYSDQEDLKENLMYGSARCEPYVERSPYDMFGWLASRHRKQPPMQVSVQPNVDSDILTRRGTGSNLPMAMKYRTLKETYKDYVGVFRSGIHGRGLYCTKDIEGGEMVIEYAGELIRSTLTDKRERYYDSKGIGCYMFKIDENLVVDATMRGNAARFINHSCEPNCYSKVVDILGHKHIIIFALRRILQGEELTYDYKFPVEDDKLPCSCSSKKCRKYLN